MSRSWIRHGYDRVARTILGKKDTKNRHFPIIKGHPAAQEHAQEATETFKKVEEKKPRAVMKEFQIYRWSPDSPNKKPYLHSYFLDLSECGPMKRSIEPWLKTQRPPKDGREYRQSPTQRKRLDGLYECILCACCSSSCPSYWWNPEEFLGPAALLHAYRWISDSRDEYTDERLEMVTENEKKLYRCRTIKNCTRACPKSLNPADAIHKMKTKHLLPDQHVEKLESLDE